MTEVLEPPARLGKLSRLMQTERFRWAIAAVLLGMLAAVRAAMPAERDQYWSARAGIESLSGVPLARPDTWSWSAEGTWFPNSPAWNVVLGLGWQALGFWGLFLVALASMALLFGLTMLAARSAGARALPTLLVFVPILLAASSALSARATVVVHAFVIGAVLFAWWWGGIAGRLKVTVATSAVGVVGLVISLFGNWVHLSFMLMAAVIAAMWAVAWWASPGMGVMRRLLLTGSGTFGLLLGCLASPYGVALTMERARVVSEICQGLIIEWTSVWEAATLGELRWIPVAVVAILVALASGVWVVRLYRRYGRFDPRLRLVAPLGVFAVPVTIMGLGSIRFLVLGMLVILPVAAAAATRFVDVVHERQRAGGALSRPKFVEYTSGRFWVTVLAGIAIVLSPVAAIATTTGARPPEVVLAEMLPEGCTLFSDAASAGPVILTRPDVAVWVDGRADFYGRQHLSETTKIFAAVDPMPTEADCVLLPIRAGMGFSALPLAQSLDQNPEWDRMVALSDYAMWVRR